MSIAYNEVFAVLADALPDFKPTPEDREDCLSYVFMSDMVRFVCGRAYAESPESDALMCQFGVLLERLISEGDSDVHDLAHDALDSLFVRDERKDVIKHFGPKTHELWERICGGEHGQ